MRIRPITISAAFTVGLATLPLSIAKAQSYPPPTYPPPPPSYLPCSPFPLEWPFCAVGAILTTAAIIVTAPLRALTGAPPFYYGYGPPPYYPPPPLLRAKILPAAAEQLRATLSPPVLTALAPQRCCRGSPAAGGRISSVAHSRLAARRLIAGRSGTHTQRMNAAPLTTIPRPKHTFAKSAFLVSASTKRQTHQPTRKVTTNPAIGIAIVSTYARTFEVDPDGETSEPFS